MARENSGRGHDGIAGTLRNFSNGVPIKRGNVLRRFGIAPAPKRGQQTNWVDFIRSPLSVLAGVDSIKNITSDSTGSPSGPRK
jgi:putative transposase